MKLSACQIKIYTPCKLMLAGEWGILEPGNSCIVLAINRYVTAIIQQNNLISITAEDIGIKNLAATFDGCNLITQEQLEKNKQHKFLLTQNNIEITLKYIQESNIPIKKFKLTLDSSETFHHVENKKIKLGIGSSAAVAVSIVKAILALHNFDLNEKQTKNIVFKLACIAHFKTQKMVGSGFDIAASAYASAIFYKRFNPTWLQKKLLANKKIKTTVEQKWPQLQIKSISLPRSLQLCTGFVGYPASTTQLISCITAFKKQFPQIYFSLCSQINTVVKELAKAIEQKNKNRILKLIKQNRTVLFRLSEQSKCKLETSEITKLIETTDQFDNKASAKFSGAGGGDCGIAICFDKQIATQIKQVWEIKNVLPMPTKIH